MTKKQPIFLNPVFKDRIWGGTKLREHFSFEIPSPTTGECWAVSAHPNGQSTVRDGELAGMPLSELYANYPDWFGRGSNTADQAVFPLLIKILDASDDLSVQVHPDDDYAQKNENGELGKTECWYILDAMPGAEIIYGHRAESREALIQYIQQGKWDELLIRVPVKAGDFFYVPSGTIHALGRGILVLETQQSSDTTYRVYDYDRVDAQGSKRELHLEKAIEVTTVPHRNAVQHNKVEELNGASVTTLVSNEFFTVQKWSVQGTVSSFLSEQEYAIYNVINGEGTLSSGDQSWSLHKGDSFILPAGFGGYQFEGSMEIMLSKE